LVDHYTTTSMGPERGLQTRKALNVKFCIIKL
jgi:hypothetical protein